MIRHLSLEEVLYIHDRQLEGFGGAEGIRDAGLVESALGRLESGYYPDVIAEGAALWESLSQNHPFIDGNKRVAFAATSSFLRLNGFRIQAKSDDVYAFVIGLYESQRFKFEELEAWLRENTAKL